MSLVELAKTLNVSPAWIKKAEKKCGLNYGSGKRGRKSNYTASQCLLLSEILNLRKQWIPYKSIKNERLFDIL